MLVVDEGRGLRAVLHQIARRPPISGTLYVLAPFIEAKTALWCASLAIARAVRVFLFTRPTADQCVLSAIQDLTRVGGSTVFLRHLHAKAFLWQPHSPKEAAAFIGSHNFTHSSESTAIELGVLISGEGSIEAGIYSALRSVVSKLTPRRQIGGWSRRCKPR